MKVEGIITEVVKYFTNHSVDSMYGYRKVTLIELPSGVEIEIDATSSVDVSVSKQLMQHNAESKKVYMDGTKLNPVKISIKGHIDVTKLADLQRLAREDVSMYVSLTKDMGGAHLSFGGSMRPAVEAGDIGDSLIDYSSGIDINTKEYIIQSLNISDSGFKNTVEVNIDLVEVVVFEYDFKGTYKYNVEPSKGVQVAGEQRIEKPAEPYKINWEEGTVS